MPKQSSWIATARFAGLAMTRQTDSLPKKEPGGGPALCLSIEVDAGTVVT
jgi:hypothetical protein